MNWIDHQEYESLKLIKEGHRSRFQGHNTMRSGSGNTIMLSQLEGTPYVCFRIVESGLEVGTGNVASAVPKGTSLSVKTRKTTPKGMTAKVSSARAKKVSDGE